jgi:hypothetical protein
MQVACKKICQLFYIEQLLAEPTFVVSVCECSNPTLTNANLEEEVMKQFLVVLIFTLISAMGMKEKVLRTMIFGAFMVLDVLFHMYTQGPKEVWFIAFMIHLTLLSQSVLLKEETE